MIRALAYLVVIAAFYFAAVMIKAVGHDPAKNQLEIEFNSGHVYRYSDVTAEEHQKFITADSIGKHFGQFIRNIKKYEKVSPQAA